MNKGHKYISLDYVRNVIHKPRFQLKKENIMSKEFYRIHAPVDGHARTRKFPGIKGVRPDRKTRKIQDAISRNESYMKLSLSEKMERNPKKFSDNS